MLITSSPYSHIYPWFSILNIPACGSQGTGFLKGENLLCFTSYLQDFNCFIHFWVVRPENRDIILECPQNPISLSILLPVNRTGRTGEDVSLIGKFAEGRLGILRNEAKRTVVGAVGIIYMMAASGVVEGAMHLVGYQ